MEITYLGHAAFRLRGKTTTVVTDPYAPELVGLKFPKHITADIVTVSHDHPDHNAIRQIEGTAYVVNGPGEYEIKGVGIIGISTFHDDEKGAKRGKNTIYRIEMDGLSLVHLGDLGHTLSAEEVDALDGVDILMIPVGGFYTIDPAAAVSVINEIEPSIVLPMHYGRTELSAKTFGTLATRDAFLKEIGKDSVIPQPKLTVTRDKLPEQMQVIILE
ncbi:MAG: MBL fold metallo-hydrolase [Candidatus Gottesmanbacteria bacterium]|nr:MBL fold metallo-hydrolase [Candidatus Gottesmanbacteria bacterium]